MLIAAIILFFLVLAIELIVDYNAWDSGQGVRHKNKPLRRGVMLLPSMVFFTLSNPWPWYFVAPIVLGMIAFNWWELFDGLYNRIRHFGWWYTGGHDDPTEPDDSKLDLWLNGMSENKRAMIKIGGQASFTSLYILSFFTV